MNCGIYQIRNLITNDIYIGGSKRLKIREGQHFSALKNNKHENRNLQSVYNKHGLENFVFEILLYCEPFELTRYEQWFVDNRHPEYNIRTECVNSSKGTIRSEETKIKATATWKRNGKFTMKSVNTTYWEEFKEKYRNVILISPIKQEFPITEIFNLKTFCYKNVELSDVLLMQLIKGKISKYRGWSIKLFN